MRNFVKTRKVLLGWLHYKPDKRKYVMVRKPDGGGTRDVDLPHDSTKELQVLQNKLQVL